MPSGIALAALGQRKQQCGVLMNAMTESLGPAKALAVG